MVWCFGKVCSTGRYWKYIDKGFCYVLLLTCVTVCFLTDTCVPCFFIFYCFFWGSPSQGTVVWHTLVFTHFFLQICMRCQELDMPVLPLNVMVFADDGLSLPLGCVC